MNNLVASLMLQLQDKMSSPAAKAFEQTMKAATKSSAAIAKAATTDFDTTSRAAVSASTRISGAWTRMYADRERLGIRSEQRIQRELTVTEGAYRRLMRSGELSWREQARAAQQYRQELTRLNNEMGRLTARQVAGGALRMGGGAIAGGVAAGMVVVPKVQQAMAYDLRLAQMANTAFAGQPLAARRAGMATLDASVAQALRFGGGTRDTAAEALDALIASGAVSPKDAARMLPSLLRTSSASGAPATELASIGIRGMQTFKIGPEQTQRVLDMALAGGQAGGFELKDMAKWLPQQMAAATASGMTGIGGFAKLVAANQAAMITAGTKDEAGNNLVNLLAKINSTDTAHDAKKLGINLPKYLAQQRLKGVDSLDAFVGLVDKTVAANPGYKIIQKRLAGAKGDAEKHDAYESMASIIQGSSIGKLIQDRQALMALVGIMNNRQYMADVQGKVLNSAGAADANFDLIKQTPSFQFGQLANEKTFKEQDIFNAVAGPAGKVAEQLTNVAREYPTATKAVVALGYAAATAAAGLAGMGAASLLRGGGAAAAAEGAGAGAAAARAGRLAMVGRAGLVGLAGLAGYGVGTGIDWGLGKLLSASEGKKDESFGGWFHDKMSGDAFDKFRAGDGGSKKKNQLEITLKMDPDGMVRPYISSPNPNLSPIRLDSGRHTLELN